MFFKRIFIALTLFCPLFARAAGPGPYYFIAVQNGAYNFSGGEAQLEESYKALQGMVKLADAQGARLTLLFSAQYAVYIASDPARLAELEGWKKTGHEVGAYHQGPDTRAWDGYSDLPEKTLERIRKKDWKGAAVPGHREYFAALGRLEPGVRSGCMPGKADKKFTAAAPVYEICGRPEDKGRNEFISVASGEETVKKRLSSFNPGDKAGIGAAKKEFFSLQLGVYGASFKSSPSEFGAFYSWLSFLKREDPQGLRSRTVSAIVDGRLLEEKKDAAAPAVKKAEKQIVQAKPEVPQPEPPRLKPLPSTYGKVGSLVPERFLRKKNMEQRGYCGDAVCDAFERARPGLCPRDCGK
ncbi:MAG: hypothetical protein Q8O90_11125 [Elusimicrobiota bacterium]|nr:hypothetical protein [Elusimicrobiota bacterium]